MGAGGRSGSAFMQAVQRCTQRKPLVVMKAGRSQSGRRATLSHTGSMAGADAVYDAALRQCGAIRVNTIEEMFDLCKAFHYVPLPRGRRVVIVTNSRRACMKRYSLGGWFQYYFLSYTYRLRLRRTGIEVWETDVPLHSKTLTVDGIMASVSSYNFSQVSNKNMENAAITYDPVVVRELEAIFERDLQHSRRVR